MSTAETLESTEPIGSGANRRRRSGRPTVGDHAVPVAPPGRDIDRRRARDLRRDADLRAAQVREHHPVQHAVEPADQQHPPRAPRRRTHVRDPHRGDRPVRRRRHRVQQRRRGDAHAGRLEPISGRRRHGPDRLGDRARVGIPDRVLRHAAVHRHPVDDVPRPRAGVDAEHRPRAARPRVADQGDLSPVQDHRRREGERPRHHARCDRRRGRRHRRAVPPASHPIRPNRLRRRRVGNVGRT